MMKRVSWMSAALAAMGTVGISSVALASSHREAPAISEDPAADNTDLYAWVEGENLVILANYIPLEEPAGGPNFHKFSDDVLYEVHIARGPTSLDDALTYQIEFSTEAFPYKDPSKPDSNPAPAAGNEFFSQIAGTGPYVKQTFTVTKIAKGQVTTLVTDGEVVPANIGPRTNQLVYGNADYEAFAMGKVKTMSGGEGRVFAGPRDDGFYVDLGAVFDLAGLRTVIGGTPLDNVAGYNTHTIALEIPLTIANGGSAVTPGTANDNQTVGVWASASRRKVSILRKDGTADTHGPWRQVSRLGLPLINEAVIGLQSKDAWNRDRPKDDLNKYGAYFLNPIVVRDAEFAGFYAAGGPLAGCGDPATLRTGRTDIIDVINLKASGHNIQSVGDVLRVDLGLPSGFPNGRALLPGQNKEQGDVTDIALSLLLCKLATIVPDGANSNDKTFRADFPFLASPHEGFSGGHGKPAP